MKVYAIPGLGTTPKIFENIQVQGYELIVLNWPEIEKNCTMQDYAKRFKDQMDTTQPFILLGLSFGGMLAVELSKMVEAEKVILISSAKTRKDLPTLVRLVKYFPVHKLIPEVLLRKIACHSRFILGFSKDYMREVKKMINEMQTGYFRNSINCIVNWNNNIVPDNCVLIHGNADRLIPITQSADKIVERGNHAMIVYKADLISKIINKILK